MEDPNAKENQCLHSVKVRVKGEISWTSFVFGPAFSVTHPFRMLFEINYLYLASYRTSAAPEHS